MYYLQNADSCVNKHETCVHIIPKPHLPLMQVDFPL